MARAFASHTEAMRCWQSLNRELDTIRLLSLSLETSLRSVITRDIVKMLLPRDTRDKGST